MDLEKTALKVRRDILTAVHSAQSGHPGGSLSGVEILTFLYFEEMRIDPKEPRKKDRDLFVLSKGHASPLYYSVLSERGFFDKELLKTFRKINSPLQGHPDRNKVAGVDMSTGSLGQGLSCAVGMALGQKLDNSEYNTYVLMGDGEAQEGIVWEALMSAAQYKLSNLIVFMDHNGLQIDGTNTEVMNIEPIYEKLKAFGWEVFHIDGHNFEEIKNALKSRSKTKPTAIICDTVKGKGISFMENNKNWHGKATDEDEYKKAMAELGGEI